MNEKLFRFWYSMVCDKTETETFEMRFEIRNLCCSWTRSNKDKK